MTAEFDREVTSWDGLYTERPQQWAFFPRAAAKRVADRKKLCLSWLRGNNVVDLGCNGGHYGLAIARTKNWCGLDLSAEMLLAGKKRLSASGLKGRFINADITAIPLKKSSFDSAICIGVLNYFTLPAVENILKDIKRVLNQEGQLIITNLRLDIFTWIRSRLQQPIPRPIRLPGPLYPHPQKKLLSLLERQGFTIKQVKQLKKYQFVPYITLIEAES